MNLLRGLIGITIGVGFFLILLILAWYIVLPLILVIALIALFAAIRNKFFENKLKVFDVSTPLENKASRDKIIDVDYTEV